MSQAKMDLLMNEERVAIEGLDAQERLAGHCPKRRVEDRIRQTEEGMVIWTGVKARSFWKRRRQQ